MELRTTYFKSLTKTVREIPAIFSELATIFNEPATFFKKVDYFGGKII